MKTKFNSATLVTFLVLWTLSIVNGWGQKNPASDFQSDATGLAKSALIKDTDGDGLSDDYERGIGRYELIQDGFTWDLAKADAEKRGGHLATIVTQAEWDSIVAVLGNFYEGKSVFIGGADAVSEGNWKWVTGEPWGFTRWAPTEPNNSFSASGPFPGDEDYLHVNATGLWSDHNTQYNLAYYLLERGFYTDPNKADTDGDGFNDGEEIANGTLPNDPTSKPSPKIVVQPQDVEVKLGATTAFFVQAKGKGVLRYQWRFNGARIIGATLSELVVQNISALDEGEYTVEISDDNGTTLSVPARLAIFHDSDGDGLSDNFEKGIGRYEIVQGNFTWQEAKADAEKRGGHLATVTSEAEWQAVLSIIGPGLTGHDTWLGGTDEEKEGVWRWITGEPWSFTKWGAGEPNNRGAENYLQIIRRDGSWNDIPSGPLEQYLFERGFYTDLNNPDTDGDGFNDEIEYDAGTLPTDPSSRPLPKLTAQPQGTNVIVGNSFQLAVAANGYGSLDFQWRFNGKPINGATGATFSVSNAQHANAGSYDVVLRNLGGSVTSVPAVVRITPVLAVERLNNGFVIIQLLDARALGWRVEASADLRTWQALGAMTFNEGLGVFLDATAVGKSQRFYRALSP